MTGDILFRVDAARLPGLSFGHVFRCLALANELRVRWGAVATFLTRDYPDGVALIRDHGFSVEPLPVVINPAEEVARAAARPERVIVFDLPGVGARPTGRLLDAGRRVTIIDDLGAASPAATRIINGNIVPDAWGTDPGPDGPARHLGPAFAILGPEFDTPPRRLHRPSGPLGVLITFGGSDPMSLTPRTARLLADHGADIKMEVALGPGYPADDDLAALAAASGGRITLHRAPSDLRALMTAADLVIAAGGRTAYELAALGVPAVLIASIEHERPVVDAFAAVGAALSVREWERGAVWRAVKAAVGDAALRQRLAMAGPGVVDGRGRQRVARLLANDLGLAP